MNPAIQESMHNQTPLHVHLISGETYIGICEAHDNPNFFIIHTDCGDLTFPYWTIKRIKTAITH